GQRHGPVRVRQDVERAAHQILGGEGERREVLPDRLVLLPRQEQHLGVPDTASGAADLLVVGDGGGRRAEVHHEAQVGLVETHAESGGGDQRLHFVGQQVL